MKRRKGQKMKMMRKRKMMIVKKDMLVKMRRKIKESQTQAAATSPTSTATSRSFLRLPPATLWSRTRFWTWTLLVRLSSLVQKFVWRRTAAVMSAVTPPLLSPEQGSYSGVETAAASAAVRRRLASILRAADSTMQRRLAEVSTELAQTDTELLCERAHSQHLAQERQEVADRERSLSRQVDVAVMVIATLREQINASENELERRER